MYRVMVTKERPWVADKNDQPVADSSVVDWSYERAKITGPEGIEYFQKIQGIAVIIVQGKILKNIPII